MPFHRNSQTTDLLEGETGCQCTKGMRINCYQLMCIKAANVWNKHDGHKFFFDQLAPVLHINTPSDWYKVTKQNVYKHGGQKMLQQYYGDSLYKVHVWRA